jgi:hypothetical protein
MRDVALFVEDFAHETFLKAIVQRLGDDRDVEIAFQPYSVRGGAGKVVRKAPPDLLIVSRDANCQGYLQRRQELEPAAVHCGCQVVYAIPDPHIERWLLLDPAAFKAALCVGADAIASDLNPVAVLINKVTLEYIPKFGTRLADDVRKWGSWVKDKIEKRAVKVLSKGIA